MKIPLPTPAENPMASAPDFGEQLAGLFARVRAHATYSSVTEGRRYQYVLIEVEPESMTTAAEQVFRLLGVKPEFLPEVSPKPYYGRVGY